MSETCLRVEEVSFEYRIQGPNTVPKLYPFILFCSFWRSTWCKNRRNSWRSAWK
jgi:hypothetical protein